MATHSSVLAWRIPGTAEPGGLPSMASHRVGHDWSDLAAAETFPGWFRTARRGGAWCLDWVGMPLEAGPLSTLRTLPNYFRCPWQWPRWPCGHAAVCQLFHQHHQSRLPHRLHGSLFHACFMFVLKQNSVFSLLAVTDGLAVRIPLRYMSLVAGAWERGVIAALGVLAFGIELTPFLRWKSIDSVTNNSTEPWDGTTNESGYLVKYLRMRFPLLFSVWIVSWVSLCIWKCLPCVVTLGW